MKGNILWVWRKFDMSAYCWVSSIEPRWNEQGRLWQLYVLDGAAAMYVACTRVEHTLRIRVPESSDDLLEMFNGKEYATWYMK